MQQRRIQLMIKNTLRDLSNLRFMQISEGDSIADDTIMLVGHLVSRRCWSSSKQDCPPECYAGLTSASEQRQRSAIAAMQSDWEHVMHLEQVRHSDRAAMRLWEDITFAIAPAIRLLFLLFERDMWLTSRAPGC